MTDDQAAASPPGRPMSRAGAQPLRRARLRPSFLRVLLLALALGSAAGLSWTATAAERREPTEVRDLAYGDVLFHYFAGDRFGAIVRLEVAQAQALLEHHGDDALLLHGGLALDYGLRRRAREILFGLLDETHTADVRRRARLALARDAWRRGDPAETLDVLEPVELETRGTLRDEVQLLRALALLAVDRPDAAADTLAGWESKDRMAPFAHFNRAVALVRSGRPDEGLALLDTVGRDPVTPAPLRDRANLAAGYSLLETREPDRAAERFGRIRLEGPYATQGLLGAGWAAADAGRLQAALGPWTRLTTQPAFDPAVQEALIALPYVYAQTLDPLSAAARFEASIGRLDDERGRIAEAEDALAAGGLLDGIALLVADPGAPAEALVERVPPSLALFVGELVASNRFRGHLERLRDLEEIQAGLEDWREKIENFDLMLATREARWAERAPTVQDPRIAEAADDFVARRDALVETFEARLASDDPMALLTEEEADAHARLEAVRTRLERLPADPALEALRDKQRVLAGVVRWQATREHAERIWGARKALAEVDAQLAELDDRRAGLEVALVEARTGFEGFAGRIDEARDRIETLLPRVRGARATETEALVALAREQLDARSERLRLQIAEARFELARLYERAALAGGPTP
ncbi:MAG: hypothetical protein V2J02_07200 [Pseudomonadales bacterium]|nr:hypothetical protein [Pseudomonadales bacterium]